MTNFDLTTSKGIDSALERFDKYGWIVSWPAWLVRQAYKAMAENAVATTEAQKQAAVEIIRAGRASGVDYMTIKMDRTAGIDLGGTVDGIPIKLKIGDSGTVEISVRYKE